MKIYKKMPKFNITEYLHLLIPYRKKLSGKPDKTLDKLKIYLTGLWGKHAFLESDLFRSTLNEVTAFGFSNNPFPNTLKSEIANNPDAL